MRAVVLVLAASLALAGAGLTGAVVARAETIEVTTTEDLPAGTGACPGPNCSLRQAIAGSKANDKVLLGGTTASPKTYELKLGSQLEISHTLTLAGSGPGASIIDGFGNRDGNNRWNRILKIAGGSEVEVLIEGVKFYLGLDENDENCTLDCSALGANGGGALFNSGAQVTLRRVAFEDNGVESLSAPAGGAVANWGTLSMQDVSFREDRATFGGGLFSHGGTVKVNRVTFTNEGNVTSGGGAVFLYRGANVTLENTTIAGSGSTSATGGGIENSSGTLTLLNDTLAGNVRGSLQTDAGARTTAKNTIIASGNSAGGQDLDCVAAGKEASSGAKTASPITEDDGFNVDQDGACSLAAGSDHSGVDPKLAALTDNGGAVETEALLSGSPALEGGATPCVATDARAVKRPVGKSCDIGAFEAVFHGAPSAVTEAANGIGETRGDVHGKIDLEGEAGGYHFLWGTSAAELVNRTPEVATGVGGGAAAGQELSGLSPGTNYFYEVVADNATGSTAGKVLKFTTSTEEAIPAISKVSVLGVTEHSAEVGFTINPHGSDTEYEIEYGVGSGVEEQHTEAVDIGSEAGAKAFKRTLEGLAANTEYSFRISAINQVTDGQHVHSEARKFKTAAEPGAPTIEGVTVAAVTDSSARIDFAISPNGANTTYVIEYGTDTKREQHTEEVDIGAPPGSQPIERTLTGLKANTLYHFVVVAKNVKAPGGVASPEQEFTTSGAPVVSGVTVASTTETTATIGFSIEPAGLPTSYVILYGLTSDYGSSTAPESVGSGREPVAVTRTLTGLEPGKTYHFAVIASNPDAVSGLSSGDVPFTTALEQLGSQGTGGVQGFQATVLPPPVLGKTFNIEPVSGTVYVELPPGFAATAAGAGAAEGAGGAFAAFVKGKRFIPLTEARQLPFGSILEASAGVAKITTATATPGKFQFGDFGAGIFKLLQSRRQRGLTQLNIINNRSRKVCATIGKRATVAKLKSKVLGRLKGSAHGKFVTRGQYSSATVRGTIWSVTNQCNGTLTKVTRDTVIVRDFARRKTITLHSGQSYLARAARRLRK